MTVTESEPRTNYQMAYEYARSVENTLTAIAETVETYGPEVTSEELRDEANELEEQGVDSMVVEGRRQTADLLDDNCIGDTSYGVTVWERYITQALDVEVHGKRYPHGKWEVTKVVLVGSIGGPDLRIVSDHRDGITLVCYWNNGDTVTIRCPDLDDIGAMLWDRGQE